MTYLLWSVVVLCVFNLIFTVLVGMNIIQLRELIQEFMEGPPLSLQEDEDAGLQDVSTSQTPYSVEPLIEED